MTAERVCERERERKRERDTQKAETERRAETTSHDVSLVGARERLKRFAYPLSVGPSNLVEAFSCTATRWLLRDSNLNPVVSFPL
jgi:hypothetical protein